ncbi:MAG TPA: DinB family protein, partial [Fimbriimonadaceae bacterium]|nr:DinB family protein [Fimbriimonadaceae bacterium]
FTVRESLALLADWEDVWSQRVRRTVEEDSPQLPDADEDQMAIDHDYRSADPEESLRTYKQSRAELVRYIRALPDSAWSRKCHREGVGEMTLFDLAVNILGHDGYHFQHTLESLKART